MFVYSRVLPLIRNRVLQVGIRNSLLILPVSMRMVMIYLRYLFLCCCVIVLICWLVLCRREMAGGRDDAAIA
jgi:hypothetical protein